MLEIEEEIICKKDNITSFEKEALQKLKPREIILDLYKNPYVKRILSRRFNNDDNIYLTRLVSSEIYSRKAAIPPYLLPRVVLNWSPGKVMIQIKVFRPEKKKTEHGNLYNFDKTVEIEGGKADLWLTTHAIRAIKKRFQLSDEEIDIGCWYNILKDYPGYKKNWQFIEDRLCLFVLFNDGIGVDETPIGYAPHEFRVIRGRKSIIGKTFLTAGMRGTPEHKFIDRNVIQETLKGVRDSWRLKWDRSTNK